MTYDWIYENSVKEFVPLPGDFFSKGDNIKIKRKVSLFFPPLVYLPFIAILSLFFSLLLGLEACF